MNNEEKKKKDDEEIVDLKDRIITAGYKPDKKDLKKKLEEKKEK